MFMVYVCHTDQVLSSLMSNFIGRTTRCIYSFSLYLFIYTFHPTIPPSKFLQAPYQIHGLFHLLSSCIYVSIIT